MIKHKDVACRGGLFLLGVGAVAYQTDAHQEVPMASLAPATFARIGTVDERFQSYNVEMLEVTGGKFWKPYGPEFDALLQKGTRGSQPSGSDTPAGMNPDLYQYRPPIDLVSARLRKFAAGLSPAYLCRRASSWITRSRWVATSRPPSS